MAFSTFCSTWQWLVLKSIEGVCVHRLIYTVSPLIHPPSLPPSLPSFLPSFLFLSPFFPFFNILLLILLDDTLYYQKIPSWPQRFFLTRDNIITLPRAIHTFILVTLEWIFYTAKKSVHVPKLVKEKKKRYFLLCFWNCFFMVLFQVNLMVNIYWVATKCQALGRQG